MRRLIKLFQIKIIVLFWLILLTSNVYSIGEIIYAVNAGGDQHVDDNGIRYMSDPLEGQIGTSSDFGRSLIIGRVNERDQILYQTERYHSDSFSYDVPVPESGNYVLVLKFSEVYFSSTEMKVFDVVLNGRHVVVQRLDIYDLVGRGAAHDEYVQFRISKGMLITDDETSSFSGTLTVEFVKGDRDNPKINAFYIMKGVVDDVPRLPTIPGMDESINYEEDEEQYDPQDVHSDVKSLPRLRKTSGLPSLNPYDGDEASYLLPLVVAFGVFVPTLVLLCKI